MIEKILTDPPLILIAVVGIVSAFTLMFVCAVVAGSFMRHGLSEEQMREEEKELEEKYGPQD